MKKKVLFIDRDGTLIIEPQDSYQVNGLEQMQILPGAISALSKLKKNGFSLIMVTNQDGLGTEANPRDNFEKINNKMLEIFASEDISFAEIFICPHLPEANCACRKPRTDLLSKFLAKNDIDLNNSYVIGDRPSDGQLAENIGIQWLPIQNSLKPNKGEGSTWPEISQKILGQNRQAEKRRQTKETNIFIKINLDGSGESKISTQMPFFDHMLEQIAKHGHLDLEIISDGDIEVDSHHSIEDIGIIFGEALQEALGNKAGLARFGQEIITPMDESASFIALDISRPFFQFTGKFTRSEIGQFPTEMVSHFFQSLAHSAGLTLHIRVTGNNDHHQIESIFKGFGRALKMAIKKDGDEIHSSKGIL